jgi:hypothetical protein
MTVESPDAEPKRRWYWHVRINRLVAILSFGLIVLALIDYGVGRRDWYHNQKARFLLIATGLFLQSIADEFRPRWIFWTLQVLSIAALAATFWLTFN